MNIYTEYYGCTMNQAETMTIAEAIKSSGYVSVSDPAGADVILIGTCVVIQHTENQMFKRINELRKFNKQLIVSGCLPAVKKEQLKDLILITPKELNGTLNLLGTKLDLNIVPHSDGPMAIPIAQGCFGKCTYCITKIARGYLKSYDSVEIIRKVEKSVRLGYKEIRITAQDTAAYGKDIGTSLPKLLNELAEIQGEFRIRVGMMEPKETAQILPELIDSYENPKIFKFLHLPVQSGDNRILKDMNREYSVEDFKNIVARFKKKFGHVTLSTDVIVGYPTETEESIAKTIDLVNAIRPDILNITRFSSRPYTKAYSLKPIPPRKLKEWSRTLTALHFKISEENNRALINTIHKVLVTEPGKRYFVGRTEGYRPVILKNVKLNEFYKVKIIDAKRVYLIGDLV